MQLNTFQKVMFGISTACSLGLGYVLGRADLGFSSFLFFVALLVLVPNIIFTFGTGPRDYSEAKETLEHLAPDMSEKLSEIIKGGRKIEAIKELRAATGLGLKEAKDVVDYLDSTSKLKGT